MHMECDQSVPKSVIVLLLLLGAEGCAPLGAVREPAQAVLVEAARLADAHVVRVPSDAVGVSLGGALGGSLGAINSSPEDGDAVGDPLGARHGHSWVTCEAKMQGAPMGTDGMERERERE